MKEDRFHNWQQRLASSRSFRLFWVFWGIYAILIVFAVGLYLLLLRQWEVVLAAIAAFTVGRLVVSPLIYLVYKRQRPYQVLQFNPATSILFSRVTTRLNAFPSDHAVSFVSVGAIIFWFMPSVGAIILAVALLNSCARVVLGYHYINNIVAGWIVGLLSAVVTIHWILPALVTMLKK